MRFNVPQRIILVLSAALLWLILYAPPKYYYSDEWWYGPRVDIAVTYLYIGGLAFSTFAALVLFSKRK